MIASKPGALRLTRWSILMLALLVTGCATLEDSNEPGTNGTGNDLEKEQAGNTPGAEISEPENPDPWEGFNRAMYDFNDGLDEYFLRPVAEGYKFILPDLVQTGVTNVFSNLEEPVILLNNLLQGKFVRALTDITRFMINSTLGFFGIFDIATEMQLVKNDEDFGQTLGYWGVGPGPFVVWPFLGPMNIRDTVGWTGDWITDPVTHFEPPEASWSAWFLGVVEFRARILGAKGILEEASSGDPYIFLREAYKQRRINKIYDGNPPVVQDAAFDDLLFSDDDVKK